MSVRVDESLPNDIEFLSQVARFWKAKEGLTESTQFGRFVIRQCLGRGGFGVVYRAWDPLLGREVALKFPGVQSLLDESRLKRFMLEAKYLGGISHPNVVEVFEANEVDGLCYIAMKYYGEGTLADWLLRQSDPMPIDQGVAIFTGIVEGVAAAHAAGLIHRDIKPSNILLDRQGESDFETSPASYRWTPVVSDFGLAKDVSGAAEQMLTREGTRLGTVGYVAPEQLNRGAGAVTVAADVYSLGVLLCELLTCPSRSPISQFKLSASSANSEPPLEILATQVSSSRKILTRGSLDEALILEQLGFASPRSILAKLRENRLDLPDSLGKIVERCLCVDPSDRFPDANALLESLRVLEYSQRNRPASIRKTARRHPLSISVQWAALVACILFVSGLLTWSLQGTIFSKPYWLIERADSDAAGREMSTTADLQDYASRMQLLFRTRSSDSLATLKRGFADAVSRLGSTSELPFEARYLRATLGSERTFSRPESEHHVFWSQLSADNRYVAFTGDKNDIVLWELDSNRIVRRYQGLTRLAHRFAFSPDEKSMIGISVPPYDNEADSYCNVLVWDVESGATRWRLDADLKFVRVISCDFLSPHEIQVSGFTRAGFTICTVSLTQGRIVDAEFRKCGCVDFPEHDPQNELLIENSKATLRKQWNWDVRRWQLVHLAKPSGRQTTVELDGELSAFAWNRRGQIAYIESCVPQIDERGDFPRHNDKQFVVWDPNSAKRRVQIDMRDCMEVSSLALSDDCESMVYCDIEGTVRYRDLSRKAVRESNPTHAPNEVWSIALHPTSQSILSGADGGRIANSPSVNDPLIASSLHGDQLVTAVSWRPNASREFASGSFDKTLRLWDAGEQGEPKQLACWEHPNRVRCLSFSPDGRFLASGCDDHVLRLWDCTTGALVASLAGHTDKIRAVAFSIDGSYLFSTSNDASVRRWNVRDGKLTDTEFTATNPLCCGVSADGEKLVYGTQGGVLCIRSLRDAADRLDLPVSSQWLRSLAISNDSRTIATGSQDGSIRLWNLQTGLLITDLAKESSAVMTLGFSANNSTLVAGLYSGEIVTWRCGNN